MITGQSDHGAVVRAKFRRGKENVEPFRVAPLRDFLAQSAIGSHTPDRTIRDTPVAIAALIVGIDEHVDDRFLETRGDVGDFTFPLFLPARFKIVPYRRFDTAELNA